MSTFDGLSMPIQFLVIGTIVVVGLIILIPLLIYLEVVAWQARHRIRKEQANLQGMGL